MSVRTLAGLLLQPWVWFFLFFLSEELMDKGWTETSFSWLCLLTAGQTSLFFLPAAFVPQACVFLGCETGLGEDTANMSVDPAAEIRQGHGFDVA